MANIKISDLTAASAAADANEFEINESGTSKKVTGSQIKAYVNAGDGALAAKDTVATADIDNLAVTTGKLAADAVDGTKIADDAIGNEHIATGAVNADSIASNAVGADEINVTGNGTAGQYLASDGDGTMTWTDLPAGGGFSNIEVFNASGTWTNPGNITKVKVTVIGGGGGGTGPKGNAGTRAAPSGGTSSFGAYCSATGGVGGYARAYNPGARIGKNREGGIGSGGNLNIRGKSGDKTIFAPPITNAVGFATSKGGDTLYGGGATMIFGQFNNQGSEGNTSIAATYGGGGTWDSRPKTGGTGGGGGTAIEVITIPTSPVPVTVGARGNNTRDPSAYMGNGAYDDFSNAYNVAGAPGVVIIEY